jgi:hypothetical protein
LIETVLAAAIAARSSLAGDGGGLGVKTFFRRIDYRRRRGRSSALGGFGSWPGRGGRGGVPGAMSGCGGSGPRSFAVFTWALKAAATSAGMFPRHARSTSAMRSLSAARRARLNLDRFGNLVLDSMSGA